MLFMKAICKTSLDNIFGSGQHKHDQSLHCFEDRINASGFVLQRLWLRSSLRKQVGAGGTKGCVSFQRFNRNLFSVATLGKPDLDAGAYTMARSRGAETNCPDREGTKTAPLFEDLCKTASKGDQVSFSSWFWSLCCSTHLLHLHRTALTDTQGLQRYPLWPKYVF